jgi:hypothetical protein
MQQLNEVETKRVLKVVDVVAGRFPPRERRAVRAYLTKLGIGGTWEEAADVLHEANRWGICRVGKKGQRLVEEAVKAGRLDEDELEEAALDAI